MNEQREMDRQKLWAYATCVAFTFLVLLAGAGWVFASMGAASVAVLCVCAEDFERTHTGAAPDGQTFAQALDHLCAYVSPNAIRRSKPLALAFARTYLLALLLPAGLLWLMVRRAVRP